MWGLLCFLLPPSLAAKTQRALPTRGRRKAAWQIKYVMWGDRRGSYRLGKKGEEYVKCGALAREEQKILTNNLKMDYITASVKAQIELAGTCVRI